MKIKKLINKAILTMAIASGILSVGAVAEATTVTLTHKNSIATIEPDSGIGTGMDNWTVDGVNNLFQQWFWYRVGAAGPESPIDTLTYSGIQFSPRIYQATYTSAGLFDIEITYTLTGGNAGTNVSDIAESIAINNLSNSSLDFHFFQYSDFDLGGDSADDTAVRMNANTVRQSDPTTTFSETVVTPVPSHWEIATAPTTKNKLTDGDADTLSDGTSPTTGDATWAYEWDTVIAKNGSYLISKDKNIGPVVPEPSTLLLLGSGLVGIAALARRKKN